MNLKTLNFHRRLFFLLISVLGISYFTFLIFFTPKIYSGFLMQLIFLTDTLVVHPQNVLSLILRSDFLIQIVFGLLWTYLLFRAVKTIFKMISQIKFTHQFVQSLNILRITKQYYVFNSLKPEVFTAGFFHPQTYLSQQLLDVTKESELSSILLHEQYHTLHHDPFKNLFIGFITSLLPSFPFKSWIFGQYLTMVEICADTYSQVRFSNPTSLVSALLKVQEFSLPQFTSGFSAQSERIKILVGQKTQPFRSVVFANVVIIVFLFVVSGSLYKTNIFYQCEHLLKCFENLITPDHVITSPLVETPHCLTQ